MQKALRRISTTTLTVLLAVTASQAQQTTPAAPAPTAPASVPPILSAPPAPPAPAATAPTPSQRKFSALAGAPDWTRLEVFRKTLTADEFEAAWKDIYSSGSPFPPPWQTSPDSISVTTGDLVNPVTRINFRLPKEAAARTPRYWRSVAELPPLRSRPPLSDVHIAIDPGHIGGAFARLEERMLSFKPGEAIQEGDLALLTAQILKPRLEALGAVVTLVRDKPEPVTEARPPEFRSLALNILNEAGVAAPVESHQGLTGDAKVLTVQWQSEKLFYRVSEIRARARKVNDSIKPDVVLCLHFNAEDWGDATQPQYSPVNHLHVMVNGCYAPEELQQEDVLHEMLGRLFSRVHETELPLAESIANAMAKSTGLPPYVYTKSVARRAGASSYVYARNLLANRLYQCPVIYLEPYVMNHQETYQRLLLGHWLGRTLVGGRLQTSAVEDYVNGIINGLVSHYQTKRAG